MHDLRTFAASFFAAGQLHLPFRRTLGARVKSSPDAVAAERIEAAGLLE